MGRKVNLEVETADIPEQEPPQLEGGSLGITEAKNTVGGAEVALSSKVFEPPKPRRFRVGGFKPSRINVATGMTELHPGQLIDDQNYDVDQLKKLGVPLELLAEG